MPNVILQSSSVTTPALAALQTPIRILKRPDPKPTSASGQSSSNDVKTFAKREAEYQAARDRIFNEQRPPRATNPRATSPVATWATPIRNPLGPTDGNGGFQKRSERRLDGNVVDESKPEEVSEGSK